MNPFDEFDIVKECISYNRYVETHSPSFIAKLLEYYEDELEFDKENTNIIIKKSVFTKNKLRHGEYIIYLDYLALQSPKLIMKANYNYGLLEGKEYYYNSKGNICRSYNYLNGKLHGLCLDYDYETGDLTRECNYHHGKIHGKNIIYENNQLKGMATYSYGKKNGYYIEFYPSGYIQRIIEFYNDIIDGSYIEYEDLAEAIKNNNTSKVINYPKVIRYQVCMYGVECDNIKNKEGGNFKQLKAKTSSYKDEYKLQEDNDYFKEFYEDLYEKYKNIVHMNVEK